MKKACLVRIVRGRLFIYLSSLGFLLSLLFYYLALIFCFLIFRFIGLSAAALIIGSNAELDGIPGKQIYYKQIHVPMQHRRSLSPQQPLLFRSYPRQVQR